MSNLRFIHAAFEAGALGPEAIGGPFDFVLVHGVLSWVPPATRDALLDLCAANLAPNGLLYVNYNCRPGWDVRGIVRRMLLAQTAGEAGLRQRTEHAFRVATALASSMHGVEHPFAQLIERELNFVIGSDMSYVAHEFMAPENHAYWRSEWLSILERHGFAYVSDADFNYDSGRLTPGLTERILAAGLAGGPVDDVVDLLSYRQLHTAIFARSDATKRAFAEEEVGAMYIATPLRPTEDASDRRSLKHPGGFDVDIQEPTFWGALRDLGGVWPRGLPVSEALAGAKPTTSDLLLLHRHAAIELRLTEPGSALAAAELREREVRWGGYWTDPYHRLEYLAAPEESSAPVTGLTQDSSTTSAR